MGVYLKEAIRDLQVDTGTGANFEFAAITCQGWRNTQEDVHIVTPNFDGDGSTLFGVFDGHNGGEVAAFVGRNVAGFIRQNRNYPRKLRTALRESFLLLDNMLMSREVQTDLWAIRTQMHPDLRPVPNFVPAVHSGSTAAVCLMRDNCFYVANIGDTRCVLGRNGRAVPLSVDNKPDDPGETARIERAGGFVNNGRINNMINVSRAFGDFMFKMNHRHDACHQMIIADPVVTVTPFVHTTDNFLVLMCDGIWNAMTNEEVVQYVHERLATRRLVDIASEIIEHILPRVMPPTGIKGKDNMTIVIVRFFGPQTMSAEKVVDKAAGNGGGGGVGGGGHTSTMGSAPKLPTALGRKEERTKEDRKNRSMRNGHQS